MKSQRKIKKYKTQIVVAACVVVLVVSVAAVLSLFFSDDLTRTDNPDYAGDLVHTDDLAYADDNLTHKSYWFGAQPDISVISSALLEIDLYSIYERERILSVSPSGNFILTVNLGYPDISNRLAYGLPNGFGWQVGYVAIYSLSDDSFQLDRRIYIDPVDDPALSGTLASSGHDGIAWNDDERQILIASSHLELHSFFVSTRSEIFLLDIENQTFEDLTGLDDWMPTRHNILPQWTGSNSFMFVRYEAGQDEDLISSLMSMDINTGEETLLSDLSYDGRPWFTLSDYRVFGDIVYAVSVSGLFSIRLDEGVSSPQRLKDISDLREKEWMLDAFTSVQISPDGRWALLTATDRRIWSRDFPFADGRHIARWSYPDASEEELEVLAERYAQPDPRDAVSMLTGLQWIPHHAVILFDIENNRMVDPFISRDLQPYVVVAAGATFAPDGSSILVSVLGDGGVWMPDTFFDEVTLFQIRIDDESFDAMRIFKTELEDSPPEMVLWFGNNLIAMRSWGGRLPNMPVQLVIPAAFEAFL
ncbi:MAG: hypothetical protein FWC75_07625 [Oscillospiraceae bacterium]|nr:hypothetical protein [Oscillospiraceae bacterium]